MGKTIRIVNYAVNGSGVGHLTRLIAASRWMRRYALAAGYSAEIYFLTSSEADSLLFFEQFASFKVPSKTVVADAQIDKTAYLALAKQWIWHSLALLRPDLLVVDTFPRGSFGELLGALDLCKSKAFIYRPLKDAFALRADFQAMLPLYDAILVPEHEAMGKVPVGAAAEARVRYVGPVASRERVEMFDREDARARLGIAEGKIVVYVSSGGGGDPGAERDLLRICETLRADRDLHVVVGAGPLYRGRAVHGERVTWLTGGAVAELMPAFDFAVSAAGYNTFTELMLAGVPTLFVPQEKIADEQELRARRAANAGAGVALRSLAELGAQATALKDPIVRAERANAARTLVPQNHARDLASELLRLVMPGREVDEAEQIVTDDALERSRRDGLPFGAIMTLAAALEPRERATGPIATRPAEATAAALDLLSGAASRGIASGVAVAVGEHLARKLPLATCRERARVIDGALTALHPFADWNAATALVRAFTTERQSSADAFLRELTAFLGGLRARGEDLYQGAVSIARAQGTNGALSNEEALRSAQEGWT